MMYTHIESGDREFWNSQVVVVINDSERQMQGVSLPVNLEERARMNMKGGNLNAVEASILTIH